MATPADGATSMAEKQAESSARTPAPEERPRQPDQRALAAAYLDLWERHVTHAAIHGPMPAPPRQGG
jgi:hypothetical protein